MNSKFKFQNLRFQLYFYLIAILTFALPLSLYLTSCAEIWLSMLWLLEGNFKNKFKAFFHNKPALILISLYLLHIIGMFYSTDLAYGYKDLRVKIPLLVLPLIFSTSRQLSQKETFRVLIVFISAVLIGTLISTYYIVFDNLIDVRQAFHHISRIRFSLLTCVAIFTCIYFIISKFQIPLFIVIALWLIAFLVIIESITGLSILFICFILYALYFLIIRSSKYKVLTLILLASGCLFLFVYAKSIYKEVYKVNKVNLKNLEQSTALGNKYTNDTISKYTENGYYLGLYNCEKELRESWNKRVEALHTKPLFYDSLDLKGQYLSQTLKRFLTSKGLRKDANGVSNLSESEIYSIEKGIPNVNYQGKTNLKARIEEVLWEYKVYKEYGLLNSSSVMQRYEFWRASIGLIKEHLWTGVGTGDMNKAFKEQYIKMKTSLDLKNRWRSHNQYLSIFVAFGIFGFIWFLITLFYPLIYVLRSKYSIFNIQYPTFLYIAFFIIALLSMLTEDTIETQTGVTFFAFFSSFFLFTNESLKSN